MSKVIFENIGEIIQSQTIQAAERKLSVTFPISYREFLLDTNGGVPIPNTFSRGKTSDGVVDKFLSIDEMLELNLMNLEYYPEIANNNLIIIAATWTAPVICIGVGQDNSGQIHLFEFEPELIADSLEDFIDGLYQ